MSVHQAGGPESVQKGNTGGSASPKKIEHPITSVFRQKADSLTPEQSIARSNISVMIRKGAKPLSHLRVEVLSIGSGQDKKAVYAIKVNNVFRRTLTAMQDAFGRSEAHRKAIIAAMGQTTTILSSAPTERYVFGEDQGSDLFDNLQQYNKAAAANKKEYLQLIKLQIGEEASEEEKALRRQVNVELTPTVGVRPKVGEVSKEDKEDRAKIELGGVHRRYRGDTASHDAEAARIFFLTQLERIAAAFLWLFTDRYSYFRGGFAERDVRTDMPPTRIGAKECSSYWVGHSTCLISVPLRSEGANPTTKTFHVLTDPVEGDLNLLLYPRKTKLGRNVEENPAIDAMCLSHNHFDHYSKPTLKKLLAMQPYMMVPEGDGPRVRALGFMHVIEQDWWDTALLDFSSEDGKTYHMDITAVPSRHWAGQGPIVGVGSAFVGHVIRGAEGGDIYYSGDTARLDDEHLKKLASKFNIRWMYQPGGPDDRRADMRSTHQASADSLVVTSKLLLRKELAKMQEKGAVTPQDFCTECKKNLKTILMHTSTFKLGNLHADDTIRSITRVVSALKHGLDPKDPLKKYEEDVLQELLGFCGTMVFSDGSKLSGGDLADILAEVVYVPKIGSRIDFERDKTSQRDAVQPYKGRLTAGSIMSAPQSIRTTK